MREKNEKELLEVFEEIFTEEQLSDFKSIVSAYDEEPSLEEQINVAYAVKNEKYEIYRDMYEANDIGVKYVSSVYPELNEAVFSNIDFEKVAEELDYMGGVLVDHIYVLNFEEEPCEIVYDGENAEELIKDLKAEFSLDERAFDMSM